MVALGGVRVACGDGGILHVVVDVVLLLVGIPLDQGDVHADDIVGGGGEEEVEEHVLLRIDNSYGIDSLGEEEADLQDDEKNVHHSRHQVAVVKTDNNFLLFDDDDEGGASIVDDGEEEEVEDIRQHLRVRGVASWRVRVVVAVTAASYWKNHDDRKEEAEEEVHYSCHDGDDDSRVVLHRDCEVLLLLLLFEATSVSGAHDGELVLVTEDRLLPWMILLHLDDGDRRAYHGNDEDDGKASLPLLLASWLFLSLLTER